MKGFIEVTENGKKKLIDIKGLWIVAEAEEYDEPHKTVIYTVRTFESVIFAEETYEEVIRRIEEAQKEDEPSFASRVASAFDIPVCIHQQADTDRKGGTDKEDS